MSLFVKVCGLVSPAAVETCVAAEVDAVGFVFADSPRRVTAETAAALAALLPEPILKVAVFRRPTAHRVRRVLETFPADVVQADQGILSAVSAHAVLPVYREGWGSTPEPGRRFLYEGPVSGVGETVDLARAEQLAGRGEMILAGGLNAGNVAAAVKVVRPFGVDVSSGVESEPGVKDPVLIGEFVAAARAAEERLVGT